MLCDKYIFKKKKRIEMVISHNQKPYKTSGWIMPGEKLHNGRSKLISSHLLDNFSWWERFVRAFLTNHASNGALRKVLKGLYAEQNF